MDEEERGRYCITRGPRHLLQVMFFLLGRMRQLGEEEAGHAVEEELGEGEDVPGRALPRLGAEEDG